MAEEHKDYRHWTKEEQAADPYGYQVAIERARAEWEQERKAEAEQRERQAKQARLEAYLKRRGEEWADTTGTTPPREVLEGWQQEYMAGREAEFQRERAEKLRQAEAHYGF